MIIRIGQLTIQENTTMGENRREQITVEAIVSTLSKALRGADNKENAQRIIAMIPARIGSTRLKMKNLALLNGKPLIAYSSPIH